MEKFFRNKVFKTLVFMVALLVVIYFGLVFIRAFYFLEKDKSSIQVDKILSIQITEEDVMGKNLPPNPGAKSDDTILGFDVNKNGIRDDVELAIFEKYPDSAKTRAVLLQYALAFQMEVNQPFIDEEIATAVVQKEDRAYLCVGSIFHRDDNDPVVMEEYFKNTDTLREFIEEMQFNTEARRQAKKDFYKKVRSYKSLPRTCDLDYLSLTN